MEQKKSFFKPSSFWNLENILKDIYETDGWLTDYIRDFFSSMTQTPASKEIVHRGVLALLAEQEYRQQQIILLWKPPTESPLFDENNPLYVRFTFRNLKRLSAASSVWQLLLDVFPEDELPFTKEEAATLKDTIEPWEKFRSCVNARRTFLDTQKCESFTKLFLSFQEIAKQPSHPLQEMIAKLDFSALTTFFSFNEDYVFIQTQMEALLRAYVFATILRQNDEPVLAPWQDHSNFWKSVSVVLSKYPYLEQLKESAFPEKTEQLLNEPADENRQHMAEVLQVQEAVQDILSKI